MDIKRWATNCLVCKREKITRHTKTKFENIPVPQGRFIHIHADLVGPLPLSQEFHYILTVIDRFPRWVGAFPMIDQTATKIGKTLVQDYLSRFGVLEKLFTD